MLVLNYIFIIILCTYVCVYGWMHVCHHAHVEVRGQLIETGSLLHMGLSDGT